MTIGKKTKKTTHRPGMAVGSRSWLLAAVLALAVAGACGGGSGMGPSDGGGGASGNGGAGACIEQPLFPFRGLGSGGTDLYRQIRRDEATGDLYFTDLLELFVLRAGAGTPQKIADEGDTFWLASDSLLFPGGHVNGSNISVLRGMSRNGGQLSDLVNTPKSTSLNDVFDVRESVPVGDDVIWIAKEMHTNNPADLIPVWDSTNYYIRKTSWRSPTTPQVLYSGTRDLFGLIAAKGKLYVSEETGAVNSNDYIGKSIDLAAGGADAMTTNDRYGGVVVEADDESLIVSRADDPTVAGKWGIFRVAPDGTGEAQMETFPALFRSVFYLAHRNGTWVFTERPTLNDPATVYAYTVAGGKRRLGCVNNDILTTNFALELSDKEVFLSVLRGDTSAAILRYPL